MIKSKIVRVKNLTYDKDINHINSAINAQFKPVELYYGTDVAIDTTLSIVDGGFYEVTIEPIAFWDIGMIREVNSSTGELLHIFDYSSTGYDGKTDCGVHKYYIKRNGTILTSAAHPNNPTSRIDLFTFSAPSGLTYGSPPNVITTNYDYLSGWIRDDRSFTLGLTGDNLKVTASHVAFSDGTVAGSRIEGFDVSSDPMPDGSFLRRRSGLSTFNVCLIVKVNRITQ